MGKGKSMKELLIVILSIWLAWLVAILLPENLYFLPYQIGFVVFALLWQKKSYQSN